jgi:hypothetical protein
MKHLIATLICIALLVLMVGIYGAMLGGLFRDFAEGKPFDPTTVTAMFSPLIYRKVLIGFIIAIGFAVLDIQALFARPDDASSGAQARNQPLKFAALRARRYLLPVVVLFYAGLFSRLTGDSSRVERFVNDYDAYVFLALLGLARRPLNMTVGEGVGYVSNAISGFLKGIAEGNH